MCAADCKPFVGKPFGFFDSINPPRCESSGAEPYILLLYHSRFLSVSLENTCATFPSNEKCTVSPMA